MRKLLATFFIASVASLAAYDLEVSAGYDHFRGMPDGSWNGNDGAFAGVNSSIYLCEEVGLQLGGSYGLYNWDGRGNLVFKNPKALEQQLFLTAGFYGGIEDFNAGLAFDWQYGRHFSIYDVNMNIGQLRLKAGYQFCYEEVGFWGTLRLNKDKEKALGVPISFRAINQANLFWSHFFCNGAMSTLWIGAPYGNSLRYGGKTAGFLTAGFALRAPLSECLYIDAFGSYMRARKQHGARQSRDYGSSVTVALTYSFGESASPYGASYMPVANHSNFLVDITQNQ